MKRIVTTIVSLVVAAFGVASAQQFLTIGTGGVVGVYYPVGGATAAIVNQAGVGLRLTVESTGGSVFNVRAIQDGQLDLALAQSDVTYQAFHGEGAFEDAPYEDIRVLFGLHAEPMHLVCRDEVNVQSFRDIAGHRVSIGNPGSGIYNTVQAMLEVFEMSEADFTAEYLTAQEQPDFLRDGRIDCFFYTVGIGGAAIRDITATADVSVVPLDDDELQTLIDEQPYYAFATVPAGTYGGQDEDVTLFGVKALFVTSADLDEETAYQIVSAVFDNLAQFTGTHPALATLTPEDFVTGLGAPLHPGAERALRERGLL